MSSFMQRALVFIALCVAAILPAQAQFTPITQPDAGYTGGTTLLDITAPDFDNLSSLSGGGVTVNFSSDLVALTAPDSWGSWGAPPNTESATPRVLWSNGFTDLAFNFSSPVDLFGFEAEPNTLEVSTLVATFFNGATEVGQIPIDVDGNGGARLFAAQTTGQFTRVTLSGSDDFAVAQLRVGNVLANAPEPSALPLALSVGIPMTVGCLRRRKLAS